MKYSMLDGVKHLVCQDTIVTIAQTHRTCRRLKVCKKRNKFPKIITKNNFTHKVLSPLPVW